MKDGAVVRQYVDPTNPLLITNLKLLLDQKATVLARIKLRNPNAAVENNLTILADKDTPYWVLMQVLYTASQATASAGADEAISFGKFRLTVLRRES